MHAIDQNFTLGAKEVQQTILVLNLSVAQIDLSISEGDNSVNALIDSFTYMSQHIEHIQKLGQDLSKEDSGEEGSLRGALLTQADDLAAKMQQAIIAFQFYDKLSQRLEHVSYGLSGLAEIVSHEMRVKSAEEWEAFKAGVRKGTTMREEEELFELIFDQHIPADQAIEMMKDRMRSRMHQAVESEADEFELF
ncbi:hypothetical protein [Thiomicrorhabdus sp.]|uniref:hypothetical protein n=1 Tax=Thiomicrorhabdus sp. TaxID=2039724 RepID=UPI0029C68C0D|nr:hypothetical protein [Thiomicrorhabdus sp.]